jgi:hypothetical protein
VIYELLKDFMLILLEIISGSSSLARVDTRCTGDKAQKFANLDFKLLGKQN